MNTAMVLIIVFYAGYGPRPHVVTQEFSSAETCKAAAEMVPQLWTGYDKRSFISATCLPK